MKKIALSLISLLPIPSLAFAASEQLSIDAPTLTQRGSRLKDMYDAQFFSNDFYQRMNSIGVYKGSDFAKIKDEETRQIVREAVRVEMVELGHSGTPSPT